MLALISIAILLAAPFLPNTQFVANFFVRALFLVWIIYNIRVGPLEGLLAVLAVVSLVVERNQSLLKGLPDQKPIWPESQNSFPKKAAPLTPVKEEIAYAAKEEHAITVPEEKDAAGEKEFESAEDLGDNIPRLREAPWTPEAAVRFYDARGLA